MPVESYAIKNGARITAIVSHTKTKNSPLVQSGLEIPVSIKTEWENEINLERLKTKVSSLAQKTIILMISKTFLGKIFRDNEKRSLFTKIKQI